MSAGRRGLVLSLAFLGPALGLFSASRAGAQPVLIQPGRPNDPQAGRHSIWQRELSPEQIRQLLARFGKGDKDGDKLLEDLIRDSVMQKNPNANKEKVEAAVKRLLSDKDFMDRMTDLAQRHKNQNPGRDPEDIKLTPEDLAKLKNARPNGGAGGDPFKLPKVDPNTLPPFDPKKFDPNNFDPEEFPHLDPKNPPRVDPKSGFPVNPRNGQPFDPRTGRPIDPDNPPKVGDNGVKPKIDPLAPPKFGDPPPPPPPAIDPKTGRPADPPNPDPKRPFDPENPLGKPKDNPEKVAKTKAVETATALWEKNVGPIEESPAVKRAILDLVSDPDAMDALSDGKGNSIFDALRDTDGGGMNDLFGGGEGGGWEWPKLDLGLDWGKSDTNIDIGNSNSRRPVSNSSSRWPSSGGNSSMGGMGSFNFGGMQVPWLLALIFLAVIFATVMWWKWEAIFPPAAAGAFTLGGVGGWPFDPRSINTREDVVKAFEYLSVLICGPGAKTWTHSTIADELTALAATHGETAVKLARLYELARYAPLDEPLTRAEVLEARRLVCDLAGVDEA